LVYGEGWDSILIYSNIKGSGIGTAVGRGFDEGYGIASCGGILMDRIFLAGGFTIAESPGINCIDGICLLDGNESEFIVQ